MKPILVFFTLLLSPMIRAEDMQKYLKDTEEMADAGKHEEALERHIWFHNHALEHEPAMYGVRLSFALSSWRELGKIYPPAMDALIETRNKKVKALLEGKPDTHLFHDVASINRTLEEPEKTVALFVEIDGQEPDVAKRYWDIAKDAVISKKRWDIVGKYLGNPVSEYAKLKESYDRNTSLYTNPNMGGAHFKTYNENSFVEESLKLIECARAMDKPEAAEEIREKASEIVKDSRLK